jgi:hypothetical protein
MTLSIEIGLSVVDWYLIGSMPRLAARNMFICKDDYTRQLVSKSIINFCIGHLLRTIILDLSMVQEKKIVAPKQDHVQHTGWIASPAGMIQNYIIGTILSNHSQPRHPLTSSH